MIDQTNDPGFSHLRVIVDRYPVLREMSKTAGLDPEEFTSLPDTAFAWPARRQFPIHNKEHTALSFGYSKTASALPTDVRETLEKAADVYGIDKKVFDNPVIEKVASDETWLLPDKKRFRVAAADDVKVAEKVLTEKYAGLTVEDRAEAFLNLKKVAERFHIKLSPSTEKLAGFTVTSTKALKDWVEARKEASLRLGSMLHEAYAKMAELYTDVDPYIVDRPTQIKLAQLIHGLDKQAGLTKYYGKKLPDPIQTVFNTTKLASEMINIGGTQFDTATLESLPVTFWQDALGEDVAQEIAPAGAVNGETLKQIIPTLPADLKQILARQLKAYKA